MTSAYDTDQSPGDPDSVDNSHAFWLQPEPGEDDEPDERVAGEESADGGDDEVDIGPPPEDGDEA